ncbi:hypothetical protein Ahy_A01g004546 isoform A [Arachis hypogaea]|uniref:peptidylprolyl isomerase n=1 Tax=Arachis hypogaea TaxID=3818 RepID=A0A445EWD4_ARAHY|nr:hypothetical protein Ahy_A01g004546 isoform A [Arachis hypogaea]
MALLTFLMLSPPRCMENANLKCAVPKGLENNSLRAITERRFSRRLVLHFLGINHVIYKASLAFAAPIMPEMKEPEVIRTLKLPSGVIIQDIVEGGGPEAHDGDLVEFNYVCRRSNGYFVYSTVDQFSGESKPVTLPLDENQGVGWSGRVEPQPTPYPTRTKTLPTPYPTRCGSGWQSYPTGWDRVGYPRRLTEIYDIASCMFEQMIVGLKEVLIGMRSNGKRRALIPPSMGYVNENLKPIPEEFGPRRSLFSHAQEPLVFEVQLLKILSPPSSTSSFN